MARPKRNVLAAVQDTLTPPNNLSESQVVARMVKAIGHNNYSVELPSGTTVLVELNPKFRSTIWVKRGGFVIIDTKSFAERDNKLEGEIVNVVRNEKEWRKQSYWPKEFVKKSSRFEESDEESNVGKLPPSDSGEE